MARFPVLQRLDVAKYGLYPGVSPGTNTLAEFGPGLSLIVGANGLGKTTLVRMLYRLLAGTHDIARLEGGGDLGGKKLAVSKVPAEVLRQFRARVNDRAKNAMATLHFQLGTHQVIVERRLDNLKLTSFSVDGQNLDTDEVGSFQATIASLSGVWSFGDWILILQYLTFYFEDRRALVWDASAQRQILRCLFLPKEAAEKWTTDERAILELDTRFRNLRAAVFREEKALADEAAKSLTADETTAIIARLSAEQVTDSAARDDADRALAALDLVRTSARQLMYQAEQELQRQSSSLEDEKFRALISHYPKMPDTARYILMHLLANQACLVCGTAVPELAAELDARITVGRCVVCDSATSVGQDPIDNSVDFKATLDALNSATQQFTAAREVASTTNTEYNRAAVTRRHLDTTINERTMRIEALIAALPDDQAMQHERRKEFATLSARVRAMENELDGMRDRFADYVKGVDGAVTRMAPRIRDLFNAYAAGFLFEDCGLVWSPREDQIGESGIAISFPAFELDMTSAVFRTAVRRSGPEQVSESQREFIDLAFRMSLMGAGDEIHGSSLVIDAPESSLDAVFVKRAAEVLGRYARHSDNRLILTSNLTDGDLLPSLLASARMHQTRDPLIDLFEIAEPTAAIRALATDYRRLRDELLGIPVMSVEPP